MGKGHIVLVPFPFTDLSGQKVRPALILYASLRGEDCIVVFITSGKQKRKYPFDIPITPSARNGIKIPSVIKVDKLATLQKKIVLGELGTLESSILKEVDRKLKSLLHL
jgi:mRNA interferase MazF